MRNPWRGAFGVAVASVTAVFMIAGLYAAQAATANVSRSYQAAEPIANGSLVSLDPKRSDLVQLANIDNGSRLVGVALSSTDSLIAIDSNTGDVQVATSGVANVLVSTIGGEIKIGDEVGVSPFSGIGMKAAPGSRIIGLAQTGFKAGTEGAAKQTVTDKNGKRSEVSVGFVRASIAIATDGTVSKQAQLNSLQRFVQGLTGHSVSTLRVILSIVISLIALLILVTLIYAAIYGSIISIGRNPLAKYTVFRTLGSVIGLALLTTGVAAVSIFFLLR